MKKRSFFSKSICVMVLVGVILALAGSASVATAKRVSDDTSMLVESFIGAEETLLDMGTFVSEDGTTKSMSVSELQDTIDNYNERVDRYFSQSSLLYRYKEDNEYRLRNVFVEPKTYHIDGGVLEYKIEDITRDNSGETANLRIRLVDYNTWVDYSDGSGYRITCCANSSVIEAKMKCECGIWKLVQIDNSVLVSDWSPLDETDSDDLNSDIRDYMLHSYSSFDEAKKAAEAIDVRTLCPLSVDAV